MSTKHVTPIDFDGQVEALKVAFQNDPRFRDFNFDGSGLASMLRMFGTVANTQSVNNNFAIGESHLSTSRILNHVRALAVPTCGYVPTGVRGSVLTCSLVVTADTSAAVPATLTITPDFTCLGVVNGASFNFSPTTSTTVSYDSTSGTYTFNNIEMTQGDWAANSFTSSSNDISQTFIIPNKSIDLSTLSVVVQDSSASAVQTTFERMENGYQLGASSKIYFIRVNHEGYYTISFGDGKMGVALADENIVLIKYMTSSGSMADDISSLTPTSEISGQTNIKITVTSKSSGGYDGETIDEIKFWAPIAYSSDGVAVVKNEYKAKVHEWRPSLEVAEWGGEKNIPPKAGFVMIATYPRLNTTEKASLVSYLEKFHVGSIQCEVVDSWEYFVKLKLVLTTDEILSNVENSIKKETVATMSQLNEKFGTFSATLDVDYIRDFIKANVNNVNSVFCSYGVGANVVKYTRTIGFDFHRQVKAGTIAVSVVGIDEIDTIKDDENGVFRAYKSGNEVLVLQDTSDYKTGTFNLLGIGDYMKANPNCSFGPASADIEGVDTEITTAENEVFVVSVTESDIAVRN